MKAAPIGSSRKVRLSSMSQVASPDPQPHANAALNGVHKATRLIQWRASMLTSGPFVQGTRLPAIPSAETPGDLSQPPLDVMKMQAGPSHPRLERPSC